MDLFPTSRGDTSIGCSGCPGISTGSDKIAVELSATCPASHAALRHLTPSALRTGLVFTSQLIAASRKSMASSVQPFWQVLFIIRALYAYLKVTVIFAVAHYQ
jgi:hypothetical protein